MQNRIGDGDTTYGIESSYTRAVPQLASSAAACQQLETEKNSPVSRTHRNRAVQSVTFSTPTLFYIC